MGNQLPTEGLGCWARQVFVYVLSWNSSFLLLRTFLGLKGGGNWPVGNVNLSNVLDHSLFHPYQGLNQKKFYCSSSVCCPPILSQSLGSKGCYVSLLSILMLCVFVIYFPLLLELWNDSPHQSCSANHWEMHRWPISQALPVQNCQLLPFADALQSFLPVCLEAAGSKICSEAWRT